MFSLKMLRLYIYYCKFINFREFCGCEVSRKSENLVPSNGVGKIAILFNVAKMPFNTFREYKILTILFLNSHSLMFCVFSTLSGRRNSHHYK